MSRHRLLDRRYEGALVHEVIVERHTRDALGLRDELRNVSSASLVVRRDGVELWRGRRSPALAASWPVTSLTAVSAGTTKHGGCTVAALHLELDGHVVAFPMIRPSSWLRVPMGRWKVIFAAQDIRVRTAVNADDAVPQLRMLPSAGLEGLITRTEYRGEQADIHPYFGRDGEVSGCAVYLPLRSDRQQFGEHLLYDDVLVTRDDEDDYLAIVTDVFGIAWTETVGGR